jgi:putative hemolysin
MIALDFLASFLIRVILFVASVLGVGFFAASETAFLSMNRWAVSKLADEGDKKARALCELVKDSGKTMSALLVGTNVLATLASVLAVSILVTAGVSGARAIAVSSIVTTATILVFSELTPKTYAARNPTATALEVALPLSLATTALGPVASFLAWIPSHIAALFRRRSGARSETPDELIRAALDAAEDDGAVIPAETEVIQGVLNSKAKRVRDIMTPIDRTVALDHDSTLEDFMAVYREERYSRMPIIASSGSRVVGVAHVKDVMREIVAGGDPSEKLVRSVANAACLVPAGSPALDAFNAIRSRRAHLAVVVDRGVIAGIVTLEDFLEEIVGDIPEDISGRVLKQAYSAIGLAAAAQNVENS